VGADLIGYLLKGPARISLKGRKFDRAAKRVKLFTRLLELDELTEEELRSAFSAQELKVLDKLKIKPSLHIESLVGLKNEYASALKHINGFSAESFVFWWNLPGADDTMFRRDPDNRRKRILFAGESTWGDEPDGYGYRRLKAALLSDVASILGIY